MKVNIVSIIFISPIPNVTEKYVFSGPIGVRDTS